MSQPPEPSDSTSDSSQVDDNAREVAEIILFESRERRKGQEDQLEHYQKLSIQLFGWTLVFWAIVVSQHDPPTHSPWFCIAVIAGVLSVATTARVILPRSWEGGPDIEDMVKGYYETNKPRRDLERGIIENLEQPYLNNKLRLDKALCAVRAQSVVSLLSVIALILTLIS